ncbi:MAG: rhodanese-like domain-containing protein [Bacteroidota bacterium]
MKQLLLTLATICALDAIAQIDTTQRTPSLVDFDAYASLLLEVKPHRAERLVPIEQFNEISKEENVIILDTRSKEMYDAKHIKGAIHLNFSDFTQRNLERIIPSPDTKILIYCNNNIDKDDVFFQSKGFVPRNFYDNEKELTLALNIPTYINLYGYGYRNIYELSELISIYDKRIQFEGTEVGKTTFGVKFVGD